VTFNVIFESDSQVYQHKIVHALPTKQKKIQSTHAVLSTLKPRWKCLLSVESVEKKCFGFLF
jgi:hypothetical protein